MEIKWRIQKITKRQDLDLRFDMKLHQMELKGGDAGSEIDKPRELTKNENEAMEIARKKAMERKAKQYGRPINN